MTTDTPPVSQPFSLRCFAGSLVATSFWPACIAMVVFVAVMVGQCWKALPDMPEPERTPRPQLTLAERAASERQGEMVFLVGGTLVVGLTMLFIGGVLTKLSGSYYEKCTAYWTTSDDPTWGGAIRAMRDDVKKFFESPPRRLLVDGWIDTYAGFDLAERERARTLIAALPPAPKARGALDDVEELVGAVALRANEADRALLSERIAEHDTSDPDDANQQPGATG